MYKGYVKLHRELKDWALFKYNGATLLLIYFLIEATHKERKISFKGKPYTLKAGQLATGRKKISLETGLSEQKIRTLMLKFVEWEEITIESTNEFSIVTLLKWGKFQINDDEQPAHQPTNNQRTTNEQPHNKNVKKVNNVEECTYKNPWVININDRTDTVNIVSEHISELTGNWDIWHDKAMGLNFIANKDYENNLDGVHKRIDNAFEYFKNTSKEKSNSESCTYIDDDGNKRDGKTHEIIEEAEG